MMGTEQAKELAAAAIRQAQAAGASYAEARVQSTWERQFVLKNGEPQPSFFAEGYGIGIRVISGGALGFAATNDMRWESVKEIAGKAAKLAKASSGALRKPIILDNSKPNFQRLASLVAARLRDDCSLEGIACFRKENPAVGASPELLDRI
jgi:predicted Zn-dependent protease